MYSRRPQKMVAKMSALREVPRRQLLQGAGAFGVAAILPPTAAFAERDDDDEPLGPFGPWSNPVNLGPVVNSRFDDRFPAISKNGLSLYITSTRPGGVNGANPDNLLEIWVSQRVSLESPWQTPINLDAFNSAPLINAVDRNTSVGSFSSDGLRCFSRHRSQVAVAYKIFGCPGGRTSITTSAGKSRSTSAARSTASSPKSRRCTSKTKRRASLRCTSAVIDHRRDRPATST